MACANNTSNFSYSYLRFTTNPLGLWIHINHFIRYLCNKSCIDRIILWVLLWTPGTLLCWMIPPMHSPNDDTKSRVRSTVRHLPRHTGISSSRQVDRTVLLVTQQGVSDCSWVAETAMMMALGCGRLVLSNYNAVVVACLMILTDALWN